MSNGLVLEGGGMRGIFTAGVLDYFLDKGLSFDSCIGVSAGSCHACSYLSGQRGRAFRVNTKYLDNWRYCSVRSLVLTGDLFGARFCYHDIPDILDRFDFAAFNRNPCRFYAVVTNCATGQAEYRQCTDMIRDIDYIQASSSMPLVSRMVPLEGGLYLDGGVADSIPIRKSQEMGNIKNVVVLTQCTDYRKSPNSMMPLIRARYRRFPALVEACETRHAVYNETLDYLSEEEKAGRVFIIRPPQDLGLGRVEHSFERLKAAYDSGYREAERRYPALKEYLDD